jgi:hypothetical protein
MEKLEFLKSTRFWALVIGAVTLYLQRRGLIGESEMILIETIVSGFIGIRTVDRLGEKVGGE